jgi:predicted TIM-barrel fold metal-dependent hydrolase
VDVNVLIDAHAHVISPDLERYPLQPNDFAGDWYQTVPYSAEDLIGLMDEAGVQGAVLVQPRGAYGQDNRYGLDSAEAHPERFVAVVSADVQRSDIAETLDTLINSGAQGFRWWASSSYLEHPEAIWYQLRDRRTPVVLAMPRDHMDALVDALTRIPVTKIALDHCGGVSFARGIPDVLRAIAQFQHVSLKVTSPVLDDIAAHGDLAEGFSDLVACFGGQRLMWGSDFSHTHDRPYPELAELARSAAARLSDDQRDAYLWGTALECWPQLGATTAG